MMQRRLHGWRRLPLMPLLLLMVLLLVLAASLVRPGTAHAQSGVTITVASTGQLIARTAVQIAGTFSCIVPAGSTFGYFEVGVDIRQVPHGQVIGGGALIGFTDFTNCDGTVHTFQVDVIPPISSPPFHGGPAIADGFIQVGYSDASGFHALLAFAGPQAIHIKG